MRGRAPVPGMFGLACTLLLGVAGQTRHGVLQLVLLSQTTRLVKSSKKTLDSLYYVQDVPSEDK